LSCWSYVLVIPKKNSTKREGELIREHNSVVDGYNSRIAGRTTEEYRAENTDKVRESKAQYRAENADKLRENQAKYYGKNKEAIN
jgi:hypothetical protein